VFDANRCAGRCVQQEKEQNNNSHSTKAKEASKKSNCVTAENNLAKLSV